MLPLHAPSTCSLYMLPLHAPSKCPYQSQASHLLTAVLPECGRPERLRGSALDDSHAYRNQQSSAQTQLKELEHAVHDGTQSDMIICFEFMGKSSLWEDLTHLPLKMHEHDLVGSLFS
jgi:hypothetical protein